MPSTPVIGSPNLSLEARVAALERAISSGSSSVQLGKTKVVAATNDMSGFTWQGATTWVTIEADVVVPTFATTVSIIAVVNSVVTSNAASSIAAASYISAQFPDLGLTQDDGSNVVIQSNQQQQRTRVYTAVEEPVSGGSTLRIIGRCAATNTGTNADNYLSIDAVATFTY